MRYLLSRTDALGDVVISLPLMERILSRQPDAEIHWLVRSYTAPVLAGLAGVAGVHQRETVDLKELMVRLAPDAVLNLGHRDGAVIAAAKAAGVPIRVARSRGRQILDATHVLWTGRRGSGRHEAQNVLDFLKPWGWAGGYPSLPSLRLTAAEAAQGEAELAALPHPRLAIATRSASPSAYPSQDWWDRAVAVFQAAGWHPLFLAPPEASSLPATDLRGLMARLKACDAYLGPSTGPTHLAAALGLPVLALMGRSCNLDPSRWTPLGARVQVLQFPGAEADFTGGMDRLDPHELLGHLDRLR